jgi:hypothetical protein
VLVNRGRVIPRRRLCWQLCRLLPAGAAAALIAASNLPGPALAANTWTTTVTVQAVGESAVMPSGQSPTATVVQGAISLTWGPSTFHAGKEVAGYLVNRQALGSATVVKVCTVVAPNRICQDSPPAQQNVMYSVVPTDGFWRGPASAPSSPVMLLDPPASPALSASPSASVSPPATPTASPSPAASPTPSPSPTASPTPSPIPTASPSVSPSSSPTPAPSPT